MIMSIFIILITLQAISITAETVRYPQCIQQLSSTLSSLIFKTKFIQLTKFLLPSPSIIIQNSTQTLNPSFIPQQSSVFLNMCISLSLIGIFFFLLNVLRTRVSYTRQIRKFLPRNAQGIITPCMMIMCICVVIFMVLSLTHLSQSVETSNQFYCRTQYLKQVVIYGDSNATTNPYQNWAGLSGLKDLTDIHIKYLQNLKKLVSQNNNYTQPLKNRLINVHSFCAELLLNQSSSLMQFKDTQTKTITNINCSSFLPQLFTSNGQWLTLLNYLNSRIYEIGFLAIQIQSEVIALRENVHADEMKGKITSKNILDMQKADIMQMNSSLGNEFRVATQAIIGSGIQLVIAFLFFLLFGKLTHNGPYPTMKMSNCLWVTLIVELMLVLIVIYSVLSINLSFSTHCSTYQSLLTDSSHYLSQAASRANLFLQLYPCFYGDSPFLNNTEQLSQDQVGLIILLGNLLNFTLLTDQTSSKYVPLHDTLQVYDNIIKLVDKEGDSVTQNWQVLTQKLKSLNNLTLYNVDSSLCYMHRWVYSASQCQSSDKITVAPINFSLFTSKRNQPISCLPFGVASLTGIHLLTSEEFLAIYNPDLSLTNCKNTINNILQLGLSIVSALQQKKQHLSTISNFIQTQKQKTRDAMLLLRTMQMQIQKYFKTLNTGTRQLQYAIGKHNNCKVLSEQANLLYQGLCVGLLSDLLNVQLYLIMGAVMLGLLIMLGAINAVDMEARQIEELIDGKQTERDEQLELVQQDKVKKIKT